MRISDWSSDVCSSDLGLQRQCGAQVTQDFIAKRFVNGARRAARGLCEGAEAFDDLVAVASGERAQLCMQTANPFWITLPGIAVMDAVDLEVRHAGRPPGAGVGFGEQRGGGGCHARRS